MVVEFKANAHSGTEDRIIVGDFIVDHGTPTFQDSFTATDSFTYNDLNVGTGPTDGIYTFRNAADSGPPDDSDPITAIGHWYVGLGDSSGVAAPALQNLEVGDMVRYTQGAGSFIMTITSPRTEAVSNGGSRYGVSVSNVSAGLTSFANLDQSTGVDATFEPGTLETLLTGFNGSLVADGVSFTVTDAGMRELISKYPQLARGDYISIDG